MFELKPGLTPEERLAVVFIRRAIADSVIPGRTFTDEQWRRTKWRTREKIQEKEKERLESKASADEYIAHLRETRPGWGPYITQLQEQFREDIAAGRAITVDGYEVEEPEELDEWM